MIRNRKSTWSVCLLALLMSGSVALSATWYVDDDAVGGGDGMSWGTAFATIQAGIDAAANGDTVLLADGTYSGIGNHDLSYLGKAITVQSDSNNPDDCVIDCESHHRGFHFNNNEASDSILRGITIMNGIATGDSPGGYFGGGIKCENGSPSIEHCVISGCSSNTGAGVCNLNSSSPNLVDCTFKNCQGIAGGGLASLDHATPSLDHCLFISNFGYLGGCVSHNSTGLININNCVFVNNIAEMYPIEWDDGLGGGIYVAQGNLIVNNSLFAHNQADLNGAAIEIEGGMGIVINCTFSGNHVMYPWEDEAAIHSGNSNLRVENSILYDSEPGDISGTHVIVLYSLIETGWSGTGNLQGEPSFVDPDGDDNDPDTWEDNDYRLTRFSRCIDHGTNTPSSSLPPDDLAGNPRIQDGNNDSVAIVDMGAFEFQPDEAILSVSPEHLEFFFDLGSTEPSDQTFGILNLGGSIVNWEITGQPGWMTVSPETGQVGTETDLVSITVDPTSLEHGHHPVALQVVDQQGVLIPKEVVIDVYVNTTLSVPEDYSSLQGVIDGSVHGDEIEIADGVYSGAENRQLNFGGKRVILRSRSGDPTRCIIDCEQQGRGFIFANGEGHDSVVEGIAIVNGYADRDITPGSYYYYGGGVLCCQGSSPVFRNCLIVGNEAFRGGGVSSVDGSTPVFTNCIIAWNIGSGVWAGGDSWFTLTNCVIRENTSSQIFSSGGSSATFCNVEAGYTGEGNIDTDPLFVDADGPDNDPLTIGDNDYRIYSTSPCVDAGTNNPSQGLTPLDPAGNPRILDGDEDGTATVDIGLYEYNPVSLLIETAPSSLLFRAIEGQGAVDEQLLDIQVGGQGILYWSVQNDTSWLNVSPTSGESNGEVDQVTLSVDISGLSAGTYEATIEVVDPLAANSPHAVSIILEIGQARHVPGTYSTIQSGIDAASDGDTVVIADGTYTGTGNVNVDFGGKAITVRSASGNPAICVIDCEDQGRGFIFQTNETLDSILKGVMIMHGNSQNESLDMGGAVLINDSAPLVRNCIFTENTGTFGGGVAVWTDSSPVFQNCIFAGNSSRGSGGAFYQNDHYSHSELVNCTIADNFGFSGSGGIYASNGTCKVTNCILWNNFPWQIDNYYDSCAVTHSLVDGGWLGEGNIAVNPLFLDADGSDDDSSSVKDNDYRLSSISPCIDTGANVANGRVPYYDAQGTRRVLDGNQDTIAVADMGAYELDTTVPLLEVSPGVLSIYWREGESPERQTLSIRNGGGGFLQWEITNAPDWLSLSETSGDSVGEVDDVILEVDPAGFHAGEYDTIVLLIHSPQFSTPYRVTVHIYVTQVRSVPGDYSTIQAAIDSAIPGDVVEIADGTYTGEGNRGLSFHGKNIIVRSASGDPEQCIIDCEGIERGIQFNSGEGRDSVLSGLTIANGYVDTEVIADDEGGGIYIENASPSIVNCVIRGCSALRGGGINIFGDSDPVVNDCLFESNTATDGAGLYSTNYATGTISLCKFRGNSADGNGSVYFYRYCKTSMIGCLIEGNSARTGGGVYVNYRAYPILMDCIIAGNSASGAGGGVCIYQESKPVLVNTLITGNTSGGRGAGVCNQSSEPAIVNCTICYNTSQADGGGMYNTSSAVCNMMNSIVWGNSPDGISNSITAGLSEVTYSLVQGGAGESWFGIGCIDMDPLFVDVDGADNDPDTWQDNNYRLGIGSPCIDAGNNAVVPSDPLDLDGDGIVEEGIPYDLDGGLRFVDDPQTEDTGVGIPPVVDMGAYEVPSPDGDWDVDGDVDLADFAGFQECYGSGEPLCQGVFDLDSDGDVDLDDFEAFAGLMTGPQ